MLHGKKKKETDTETKKNLFTRTSEGFLIVVRNTSFIDSKQYYLEPTYLLTILKVLVSTKRLSSCDGNDHKKSEDIY